MNISELFDRYKDVYSLETENERVAMGGKRMNRSAYNEVLVSRTRNGRELHVQQHEGNFFKRGMFWIRDKFCSYKYNPFMKSTRKQKPESEWKKQRDEAYNDLAKGLGGAVRELCSKTTLTSNTGQYPDALSVNSRIKEINTARDAGCLPLRAGLVRKILRDFANEAKRNGLEDQLPDFAREAFLST